MIGDAVVLMFGFFAVVTLSGFGVLTLLDAQREQTL
jgi:hypothetical protein